jgi:hypothetical protein
MTKTIRTTSGHTLYVVTTIPQVDGSIRYICAETERDARDAAERIRHDPAVIDYLKLIPVTVQS